MNGHERSLQIRVGALVLAGAAGVVGLLLLMGEVSLGRGDTLRVDYAHTGNVVVGAPVRFAGVNVGRVEKVQLLPDRRDARGASLPVQMELKVDPAILPNVHADALVTVATQGPLGEPYLELGAGTAGAPRLQPGATLRGTDAPRLDLLAAALNRFLESATGSLEKNPRGVPELLGGIGHLVSTLDEILGQRKEDLGGLITDLAQSAKDLRALAALTHESLVPGGKGAQLLDDAAASVHEFRRDWPQLAAPAQKALSGAANVASGFTPEDGQKLREALERYARAGADLERIAGRTDRILARIEAGEGTLGGFQKDPQVYQDLRALLADLRAHPWKMLWKN